MNARQPLPGLMPSRGERVRVVMGMVQLDADMTMERTALAFVAGEPVQSDAGDWLVPVVGHGNVPAGMVKRIA